MLCTCNISYKNLTAYVSNLRRCASKLVPHEELLEFCPKLLHDPEYQWMVKVHHAGKISNNKFNQHDKHSYKRWDYHTNVHCELFNLVKSTTQLIQHLTSIMRASKHCLDTKTISPWIQPGKYGKWVSNIPFICNVEQITTWRSGKWYKKHAADGQLTVRWNERCSNYNSQWPALIHFSSQLVCGPMPNVIAALPSIGGALCSMPQSLADAHGPLLECHAVAMPRSENRWNLLGCSELANRSQPFVGRSSPYCKGTWGRYCSLTIFLRLSICALVAKI